MDQQATAKIIASSTAEQNVCAAAGRISTTQGTALEVFQRTLEKDNNSTLIEKVVGSGHTSTLEHQFFTVAFDSVSVFTEQFVIEFRLGSYTVQSRRYVDYSNAGFYMPPMDTKFQGRFQQHMESLFQDYTKLLALDIPKEDARFLLPYCFRSNFFCTMNARELIHMILTMTQGRGSHYPELKMLGESLTEQIKAYFPNVTDILAKRISHYAEDTRYMPPVPFPAIQPPTVQKATTHLYALSPANPEAVLQNAAFANWMIHSTEEPECGLEDIIHGERTRELELIHVQFNIQHLSLAAVTHLVRHRVQTVLVPHIAQAVLENTYLLPESVRSNPEALQIYENAYRRNTETAAALSADGFPSCNMQYFALAGNQLNVTCAMNGRELLHFMKLRTCTRAQWEIRACAMELLQQLRQENPALFRYFGPSCYVNGTCPEGRLSCGMAAEIRTQFSNPELA